MIVDCIDEEKLDYEYGETYPDTKKPDKFSHRKWVYWEETVYNYFTDVKDSQGLSLTYIILKTPNPSGIVMEKE